MRQRGVTTEVWLEDGHVMSRYVTRCHGRFGRHGKEDGSLGQLLQHELGLPLLATSLHPRHFTVDSIKVQSGHTCYT